MRNTNADDEDDTTPKRSLMDYLMQSITDADNRPEPTPEEMGAALDAALDECSRLAQAAAANIAYHWLWVNMTRQQRAYQVLFAPHARHFVNDQHRLGGYRHPFLWN